MSIFDFEVNLGYRENEPNLRELVERYYVSFAPSLFTVEEARKYADNYIKLFEAEYPASLS